MMLIKNYNLKCSKKSIWYQIVDFCYEFIKKNSKADDVAKKIKISENSANKFKLLCQVSNVEILADSRKKL